MQDKNAGTILIDLVKNIKVVWEKVGERLPGMDRVIAFFKKLSLDSHLTEHIIYGWKNGEIVINNQDIMCAFHYWRRMVNIKDDEASNYLVPYLIAQITKCIYQLIAVEIKKDINQIIEVFRSVCECATPYHALEIKNEFCELL